MISKHDDHQWFRCPEAEGDFAHQGLAPRQELGTVGLWCALHGESMLSAGLHHLAGRFDFDAVTAALAERGVPMMHPFSEFAYLRLSDTCLSTLPRPCLAPLSCLPMRGSGGGQRRE